MNLTHKKTAPSDPDFMSLVHELDLALSQMTGDSGAGSFSPAAFNTTTEGCIVIYHHSTPVACGVFRYHADQVCELKRMYSKQPGAGTYLLQQLERDAMSKGYRRAILSTRQVNTRAINFYKHNGYLASEAYGKYVGLERSSCFSKTLLTPHEHAATGRTSSHGGQDTP